MNLSDSVTEIPGIGNAYAKKLERLNIKTVQDLLLHPPSRYIDYSIVSPIANIQEGETVTIRGRVKTITSNFLRGRRLTIQRAVIEDESGEVQLTFFNQPFLVNMFIGNMVGISGTVKRFGNKLTFDQPEYEVLRSVNGIHTGRIVAIYPQTEGISSKWLRVKIALVLDRVENYDDPIPQELIEKNSLLSLKEAILNLHQPQKMDDSQKARVRFAFDELLYIQLMSLIRKRNWQAKKLAQKLNVSAFSKDILTFISRLPFTLTHDQKRAVDEILSDLAKETAMNRLLSGDVGSGKTVVSAIAIYISYLNSTKALFMAPTEILAYQHFNTLNNLLAPFKIKVGLKTSSYKNYKDDFDVLVGTHALLHDNNLPETTSLIIIDEQHRFGVEQRSKLSLKLGNPHLLTMTATPIPRTIALTLYGELDVSTISQMPKGRKKIKTFVVPKNKQAKGYEWIANRILSKRTSEQAFIIYPLIEESEKLTELKAATSEYLKLKKGYFEKLKVGLLHGKMKSAEKEKVMRDFKDKKIDILISTTVIEVGMDIPNATIMVIEHAERFGLAQLHQLRGRVGRNDKESWCFLFSDMKSERLKAMETNYSGIALSEIDFKLRGSGEIFGTKQHGRFELLFARFTDSEILRKARNAAQHLLNTDKHLAKHKDIRRRLSGQLNLKVLPN